MWCTKAKQVSLGTWKTRIVNRDGVRRRVAAPRGVWLRRSSRSAVYDLRSRVFFLRRLVEALCDSWQRHMERLSESTRSSWERVVALMAVKLADPGRSAADPSDGVWWRDCWRGWMTIAARNWMCIIFGWCVEERDNDYGYALGRYGTINVRSVWWCDCRGGWRTVVTCG
jgi:hypothetical protein